MKKLLVLALGISCCLACAAMLNAAEPTGNVAPKVTANVPAKINTSDGVDIVATPNTARTEMERPMIKMTTNKGDIAIELYPDVAPQTVEHFLKLTRSGFYDGLKFHRVIPGFVAQGGDPQTKGEQGKDWTLDPKEHMDKGLPLAGTGGPGYTVKAEFNERKHETGTLAMARSADPDSAGSQFYICLAPQTYLDGKYTVFGQVTSGMENVLKLTVGDTMEKVVVLEKPAADTVTGNTVVTENVPAVASENTPAK